MNNTKEAQLWLFPVEPSNGESLSHFLGRFRRSNHLSPSALGDLAGIGGVVARWERFHLNPFPTDEQFQALAEVVDVDSSTLREMLPPKGTGMKCDRHNLKLISKCPNCRAKFKMPALWEYGCCHRCRLPFAAIAQYQQSV
ncbi:transcriptional regulator [Myxosarcina sp. GI1]|uniref:transcriptional regulator n=1 Tax=Myxosarcina sp. GI1 TaxID=1541065 RepID=UPI00056CE862|nr:transcriptional regulator [Myxosarcina sp. GI1]